MCVPVPPLLREKLIEGFYPPTALLFFFHFSLFMYGCAGSLLLHICFLQLLRAGAALQLQCRGCSLQWLLWLWSTGSVAAGAPACGWAQWLWHTGLVARWYVASSQTQQGKERVGQIERLALKHVYYRTCNRQQVGSCCITQGAQLSALWQPRGVGWGGAGREVQEGGDMYILMADSCCCMAETNTTL